MGTIQHFALFEHVTGYGLFRIKEFDEITHHFTAHVNAFIKPVAFLHFESVAESVENVQSISDGVVTPILRHFLRLNVPSKNSILGVSEEKIGKAILSCDCEFQCVWHASIREVLRVIRSNFTRLARSLVTQPGNAFSLAVGSFRKLPSSTIEELKSGGVAEARARLVVGLARASLQLKVSQYHFADSAIIKAIHLLDDLDVNLVKSASRLRRSYGVHFPEVCWPGYKQQWCLKDIHLIKLIASCPSRKEIGDTLDSKLSTFVGTDEIASYVKLLALKSIGSDLLPDDEDSLKKFATHLLNMIQMREHHIELLTKRINVLVPNLAALLDEVLETSKKFGEECSLRIGDCLIAPLVVGRLLVNAGSLMRLAIMPTSRILSLGASKAVFRKSGAVAATSTGLVGSTAAPTIPEALYQPGTGKPRLDSVPFAVKEASGNRLTSGLARRKAARLLAAKASLASRADFFRSHNPIQENKQSTSTGEDDRSMVQVSSEDPRLKSGSYGKRLGCEVQHQLRAWAEANGVHTERTSEELKVQRERRKKYRKAKRKAWLVRKLTRAVTSALDDRQDRILFSHPTIVERPGVETQDEEIMQIDEDTLPAPQRGDDDSDTCGGLLESKLPEMNALFEKQPASMNSNQSFRGRSLRTRHIKSYCA